MKRIRSLVAIGVLVAMAIATVAWAAGSYSGQIHDEHDGTLDFNLVKTDNGRFVKRLGFQIFITCDIGKSGGLGVEAEGRFRVKRGHWDATRPTGPTTLGDGGEVRFTGDVQGGKSEGTIKFVDHDTPLGACKSGKRDWEASKVPPG